VFRSLFEASGSATTDLLDRLVRLALERTRPSAGIVLNRPGLSSTAINMDSMAGIESVAVVGGGFMGTGIAESVAVAGLPVIVYDIDTRSASNAPKDASDLRIARVSRRQSSTSPTPTSPRGRIELTTEMETDLRKPT